MIVPAKTTEKIYDFQDSLLFDEGEDVELLAKLIETNRYGQKYPAFVYVRKKTNETNTCSATCFDVDQEQLKTLPTLGEGNWETLYESEQN